MRQAISGSANYKWWAFGTIAIGTFMSVIDHGSVVVALPSIERHFDAGLATVQWVTVGYALAISVLLLPMGRLSDILGRKRVYMAGLVIFVVAAAVAGFSRNLWMLILAKVVQGAGSAMVQSNGMAMIISVFPGSERGKALGTHMSVVGTGAIVGPALGGLLVSALGWQAVFFINVPTGLVALLAASVILDKTRFAQNSQGEQRAGFDWRGAGLSGMALLTFLLAMTNAQRAGWDSPLILSGFAAFAGLLGAFIWWGLRCPSPMLDLRLFKRRLVAMGVAAGWLSFLGTSSAMFMMPFYLQRVLDYSPSQAGLMVIPGAACMAVLGPISGRLSDRFGWRRFNVAGLAMSSTALLIFATFLSESSSLALIIPVLMLQSCGMGTFNSPNNSSILSAVERSNYGVVSALTQLMRNSANVTSIALATAIVVATMASQGVEPSLGAVSPEVAGAFMAGLQRAYFVLGGLLVLGLVVSYVKGDRPKEAPSPAPQARVEEPTSD